MTLQSPTATLIPLFSSSEVTGCGYPGLLDRKNRSDMCPRWDSNPRLPACKASTISTRSGSPLIEWVRSDFNQTLYQPMENGFEIARVNCGLVLNVAMRPAMSNYLKSIAAFTQIRICVLIFLSKWQNFNKHLCNCMLKVCKLVKIWISHPLDKNIPFYRCLRFFYPSLLSQPRLWKLSQSANHCLI